MDPEKKYDVIVIGAGLNGLTAAIEQAEKDKKVLILEKNNAPGGRAAVFRRGSFEFETGSAARPGNGYDTGPESGQLSGRSIALILEDRFRTLGGNIWYKTAAVRIDRDDDHDCGVVLENGKYIPCDQIFSDMAPAADEFNVFLGLDISAEKAGVRSEIPGCRILQPCSPHGMSVLQLTRIGMQAAFEAVDEKDYFPLKDRITEEIVRDLERTQHIDIRHHITEIDSSTPITEARYSGQFSRIGDFGKAASLHPQIQFAEVLRCIDRGHAKSFVIGPDPDRGTESLAYFRAGQYISIQQQIGRCKVWKPYSICCSPLDALGEEHTSYTVMIERNPDGFFSPHALDTWTEGTKLILSGPVGSFYHHKFRDADHVVALAGSSGITPFFSMAAAIADGIEHFDMTILYGSNTEKQILLKEELDDIVRRADGKVRVIHVLADEVLPGYEHGFITPDLIRKYAPAEDYSVLICGPQAMYSFLHKELPSLGLSPNRIRFEVPGEFGDPSEDPRYPEETAGKEFQLTVLEKNRKNMLQCRWDQTLMQAIERSGLSMEAGCRSGQCGWCRSKLISGKVFVPKSRDGRCAGDAEHGWIHPCVTYPLSDVVLEISNY